MAQKPTLLDRWGNPVIRQTLSQTLAAPTLGGVRSPTTGYPGDGLNPVRLANILKEADQGDPVRYLELAETIEERDPHFLGVIGTRKRSVSQIPVTVVAASDSAADEAMAQMVRDWLDRDELQQELFHILDCISKGFSFTEIRWNTSEGQYFPEELVLRDPRSFRFARHDLTTPMMLNDQGQEVPLEPFHFIMGDIQAKSGLPLRSGLARVAMWGWMFKAFTSRDWSIFSQTYGQPLRLGKWQPGASEEDKATLFRAVANIAGDCAGIIPASMEIEFVESKSIGASGDLYEKRIDHLDRQISKAVLGQTATTDADTGGLGSGKEHRQVQEDIERADAGALAAILNRDLIRPWVQLEYGPQKRYPRLKIAQPETVDLQQLANSVDKMVKLGMEIEENEIRSRFGFATPKPGARLLKPPAPRQISLTASPGAQDVDADDGDGVIERRSAKIKRGAGVPGMTTALQTEGPSAAISEALSAEAALTDQLATEAQPEVRRMLETVEAMLAAAGSLEEFREMLAAGFGAIDSAGLAGRIEAAMLAAQGAGRLDVDSDG